MSKRKLTFWPCLVWGLALALPLAWADGPDTHVGALSTAAPFVPSYTMGRGLRADEYTYDDGTTENSVGLANGGDMCHMHMFDPIEGLQVITHVSSAWGCALHGGSPPDGTVVYVYVWDDPNNDGDPSDAVLLGQGSGTIVGGDTDLITHYQLDEPVTVTSRFFIGAQTTQAAGEYPSPMDDSQISGGRAWVVGNSVSGGFNPVDLTANDVGPYEMDSIGYPCVFLLRADAVGGDGYLKMNPPPDVDKATHGHAGRPTCWQATAANMLAGAGYGVGATVQARADSIYLQLTAPPPAGLGSGSGGWTDTALTWWLASAHNIWPANPYDVVTVHGNKTPKNPWANPNGAQFIGNELRRCQFVGLSISWPVAGATVGTGGHAITGWGDSGGPGVLPGNPAQVKVTDSDKDPPDVQTYTYDAYNNPNPGGPNEGNGWYFDYSANHPYIKHIVTLCPTDDPNDHYQTQKVVGSYRIHQDDNLSATDLHYEVGTDTTILSYRTTIDWPTGNSPIIIEFSDPNDYMFYDAISVDWDLSDNPVPYCTWITITTEFVLPTWNAVAYRNVHFTYPSPGPIRPGLRWELWTEPVEDFNVPNITGGYVVGGMELYADPDGQNLLGEYRFQHEYDFMQDPEQHEVLLESVQEFYYVGYPRFGHSYGILDNDSLWEFEDWIDVIPWIEPIEPNVPLSYYLNWDGLLPYPRGDDVCQGDLDDNGVINLTDLAQLLANYGVTSGAVYEDGDLDHDGDVDLIDLAGLLSRYGVSC